MNQDATHAYVGFRPCGCLVFASVDLPDEPKRTAKNVAEAIRDGLRIERQALEVVRATAFGCEHRKAASRQLELP